MTFLLIHVTDAVNRRLHSRIIQCPCAAYFRTEIFRPLYTVCEYLS